MCQNAFAAGTPHLAPLGELTALLRPVAGFGAGGMENGNGNG